MNRGGLRSQLVAAARNEIGFVLLTAFGVILTAIQVYYTLADVVEVALAVVGTLAILLGGAGFGAALGRERQDEGLRLKTNPLYRRTISLYQGISDASWELGQGYRETTESTKPSGQVDGRIVRRRQERLDMILQQQTKTLDAALDEWRELLPERVDDTVKKLRKEGRLS